MKVLIFGASGATGRLLVDEALRRGHDVTAFVRDPSKLAKPDTPHVQGDATDLTPVRGAMVNQDAVLCALGSRTLKRDPELVDGVRNIVTAMEECTVRRLVYVSSMGVRESRRQLSWLGRFIIAPLLLRSALVDHEEREDAITSSDLEWTTVRPAQLTNGPVGSYRSGEDIRATNRAPSVSRATLAAFMLDQLDGAGYVGAKPGIMD